MKKKIVTKFLMKKKLNKIFQRVHAGSVFLHPECPRPGQPGGQTAPPLGVLQPHLQQLHVCGQGMYSIL